MARAASRALKKQKIQKHNREHKQSPRRRNPGDTHFLHGGGVLQDSGYFKFRTNARICQAWSL